MIIGIVIMMIIHTQTIISMMIVCLSLCLLWWCLYWFDDKSSLMIYIFASQFIDNDISSK